MQTNLEIKAIKKRNVDTVSNSAKVYGKPGNEVKGNSSAEGDDYDVNGSDAKKGGESTGSLVDHLNSHFDLVTGGDVADKKEREKQQAYVVPGTIAYSAINYYSDEDNIKVDTSANVGQVVIY